MERRGRERGREGEERGKAVGSSGVRWRNLLQRFNFLLP